MVALDDRDGMSVAFSSPKREPWVIELPGFPAIFSHRVLNSSSSKTG
jgi:hypothetical protein